MQEPLSLRGETQGIFHTHIVFLLVFRLRLKSFPTEDDFSPILRPKNAVNRGEIPNEDLEEWERNPPEGAPREQEQLQ